MNQKQISRGQSLIKSVPRSVLNPVFLTIAIIFVVLVVLIAIFGWEWTGFARRTLYEWLDILIIPIVLAVGVYWLEVRQGEREQAIADQRAQERAQDAALQAYFNEIGQLLFDRQLRDSEEGDEVRALSRSRTLAILDNLDAIRKRHLLQFLYEARLINREGRVVPLDDANLRNTNLRYITLEGAALDGAILENADLKAGCNDIGPANLTLWHAALAGVHHLRVWVC